MFIINWIRSDELLSCVRLCDPMNRSTPGFSVHHQLPEFTHRQRRLRGMRGGPRLGPPDRVRGVPGVGTRGRRAKGKARSCLPTQSLHAISSVVPFRRPRPDCQPPRRRVLANARTGLRSPPCPLPVPHGGRLESLLERPPGSQNRVNDPPAGSAM